MSTHLISKFDGTFGRILQAREWMKCEEFPVVTQFLQMAWDSFPGSRTPDPTLSTGLPDPQQNAAVLYGFSGKA